jgi:hypothetical protein
MFSAFKKKVRGVVNLMYCINDSCYFEPHSVFEAKQTDQFEKLPVGSFMSTEINKWIEAHEERAL